MARVIEMQEMSVYPPIVRPAQQNNEYTEINVALKTWNKTVLDRKTFSWQDIDGFIQTLSETGVFLANQPDLMQHKAINSKYLALNSNIQLELAFRLNNSAKFPLSVEQRDAYQASLDNLKGQYQEYAKRQQSTARQRGGNLKPHAL